MRFLQIGLTVEKEGVESITLKKRCAELGFRLVHGIDLRSRMLDVGQETIQCHLLIEAEEVGYHSFAPWALTPRKSAPGQPDENASRRPIALF